MLPAPLSSHGGDGSLRPLPGPGTQVGRSTGLGPWEQENGLDQTWLPAATLGLPLSSPKGFEEEAARGRGPRLEQLQSHTGAWVLEPHPGSQGSQPCSAAAAPWGAFSAPLPSRESATATAIPIGTSVSQVGLLGDHKRRETISYLSQGWAEMPLKLGTWEEKTYLWNLSDWGQKGRMPASPATLLEGPGPAWPGRFL